MGAIFLVLRLWREGTLPSRQATSLIRIGRPERSPSAIVPYLPRVILGICLLIMQFLIRNMGDHENKSESETRVIAIRAESGVYLLIDRLKEVEKRVIRMERAYDALGRRLEGSERHVEDEGWFD